MHLVVDTLVWRLIAHVTSATAQNVVQVAELEAAVQDAIWETMVVAEVDKGSTGGAPHCAAATHGIEPAVVTRPTVKRDIDLLPRHSVGVCDVVWMNYFRRLVRDQERLADVVTGTRVVASLMLMWPHSPPAFGGRRQACSLDRFPYTTYLVATHKK